MESHLTALLSVVALSLCNVQADVPACNIMLSGHNTYFTMKPFGHKTWKAVGNDGRYLNTTLKPGSDRNFHLFNGEEEEIIHYKAGNWDASKKCLKNDSIVYNSTTDAIYPKVYANQVKILMRPPFAGKMATDPPASIGNHIHFDACLNVALSSVKDNKRATGLQWSYVDGSCRPYYNDVDELGLITSDMGDDTKKEHVRSMIFKPLPLMGSTLERLYAGSNVDTLEACAEMAKQLSSVVKAVSLSRMGECYYSKQDTAVEPFEHSDYWVRMTINYISSSTTIAKPAGAKKMICDL